MTEQIKTKEKSVSERLKRSFNITERALAKIKISEKLTPKEKETAKDFLDMAQRYYQDAKHFANKKEEITALAAVSYAHAFLDAGARAKFFEVHDNELFASD